MGPRDFGIRIADCGMRRGTRRRAQGSRKVVEIVEVIQAVQFARLTCALKAPTYEGMTAKRSDPMNGFSLMTAARNDDYFQWPNDYE